MTWPVVVALPPGTTNMTVWVQSNPYQILPAGITVTPVSAVVTPYQSATFQVTIDPTKIVLDIGKYPFVPVTFNYVTNGVTTWSQSITLNLDVIDSRLSQLPPSSQKMIPHIAAGGGWKTVVRFVNPGDDLAVMRVNFLRTSGNPLPLVANNAYGTDAVVNIAPHGVTVLTLTDPYAPGQTVTTGHAEVFPHINGSKVGFSIAYEFPNSRGESMEAATPGTNPHADTLNLLYDLRNGAATGMALSNAMNYPQSLSLTFYDEFGKVVHTSSVVLVARGQVAFTLDKTSFPQLVDKQGIVVVKGQFKALSGLTLKFTQSGGFIPLTSF